MIVGTAGVEAVVGMVALILVCRPWGERQRSASEKNRGLHSPNLPPASSCIRSLHSTTEPLFRRNRSSLQLHPTPLDVFGRILLLKSLTCSSPHPVQDSDKSPAAVAQMAGGIPWALQGGLRQAVGGGTTGSSTSSVQLLPPTPSPSAHSSGLLPCSFSIWLSLPGIPRAKIIFSMSEESGPKGSPTVWVC